ncbi:MAG: zinc ribbon domain-containing protein [Desulfobacteraceae bacterium]|nr:zinc ribbon domain-containing protein [Desulfobacteraceae bacterium]
MKCPVCQHENPNEADFCIETGKPIEFHCPSCGVITPATGKFFMKCGHNLSQQSEHAPKEPSIDEKIEKIQKYLPRDLNDQILSKRDKIEGEHKQEAVMFADMEGFTPLVEKIGSEEA